MFIAAAWLVTFLCNYLNGQCCKFLALHIDNFLFLCYPPPMLKKQIPIGDFRRRAEIGKKGEQNEISYETFFDCGHVCSRPCTDWLR
jgi:hypothetical protein